MKRICTILFLTLSTLSVIAQKKGDNSKVDAEKNLLPSDAFDKMIIQDITYAIFGESSPVSGIKVDISKPEATISGVFQSKKNPAILTGLEFKGGITDKSFSIFKGLNNFNTAFEFRPSIHIIPSWNKAKYYTVNKPILEVKNDLVTTRTKALVDSFYAMALIYNAHLANFTDLLDETPNLPTNVTIGTVQKGLLIYFIKKLTKIENAVFVNTSSLGSILAVVPPAVAITGKIDITTYNDEIIETYNKYEKLFKGREEEELSRQISNVSKAWSQKKYWWFTFGPIGRAEKITEYHTKYEGRDSLYFKPNYPFYYGINIMINRYRVWPNKIAFFWRLGINLSRANNIVSLSNFNYETRTPFFSSGTNVTEKIKTGAAYNYDQVKSDFANQLFGEIYLLPLRSFIPGIYFSSSISKSRLYKLPDVVDREKDKTLIPMEGGLVFNINSREKDKEKSILSLSVYTKFEDITDKKRVSRIDGKEETREDFMKRNFSLGIKVGIPITLPQRAD